MACQLNILAVFDEVRAVKRFLFPEVVPDQPTKDEAEEGWDDSDWGWQDEEEQMEEEEDALDEQYSWLQECCVSLSPAAELMAIAHDDKLVLLSSRWGNSDTEMHYSVVYQGIVQQEPGEFVTCVNCLPLASQKRSTQGGPDWTCVIVGFSSGYVRMYTESGTVLLSQLFSMESVQGIKCRTYEPPRHSAEAERHEELSILYRKSLVTIDGFSLVQSLRACRNQVARAAASGNDAMQAPPLAYKKWALQEQETISDLVACGVSTPNAFDQLSSASMYGGYTASIRSTPPASHLYVTTGAWPYAGFFHAVEGSAQPMLSDVAHAVASKLKSALFTQISAASGWLGLGGSSSGQEVTKVEKKPKIEPATALPLRFGLYDKRRQGETLCLSPDGHLLATTDSFGRVILIDVARGVAVRMWKGYRDAQVAFVSAVEDQPDRSHRHCLRRALFLVIYAPRRGILEVWTLQNGPRVAAFNVSKWSQLLCPGHGLMGLNNVTYREARVQMHPVFLVDSDGSIRIIDIPFHLALSDKNHKQARDLHLLKKLKAALKEGADEDDKSNLQGQVIGFLLDMRLSSFKQQGLQRVLHTHALQPEFLAAAVRAVHEQMIQQQELVEAKLKESESEEQTTEEHIDYESRSLLQFCMMQLHLLKTYARLMEITSNCEKGTKLHAEQHTVENLLGLTSHEAEELTVMIDKFTSNLMPTQQVTFEEDVNQMTAVGFLKCFKCHMPRSDDRKAVMQVELCDGLSSIERLKLAKLLYGSVLEYGTSSDYNQLLSESHIDPQDMMNLLLELWLNDESRHPSHGVPLHNTLKSITCLKEMSDVSTNGNKIPLWWQGMRDLLSQSENILAALIAALVGRSIAMDMARVAMMTESTDSGQLDMSEWESVTLDRTAWTVLIRQLEDLLCLCCLLAFQPPSVPSVSPASPSEPIKVSVKRVLDGGKGMLPEFVAKWIACHSIAPSMLCVEEEEEEEASGQSSDSPRKRPVRSMSCSPLVGELQFLQQRLPHSLDADVLMVNCCWEFLVLWNKDPESIQPLTQALDYLRCIHHATLQHGLAVMIWQMFLVKKVSSAALLMEKIGKAPKDRLSRRDVGLSDVALEKFMDHVVQLLQVLLQAVQERQEAVVLQTEDLWQASSGPTSLVELSAEQKLTNEELLEHHLSLCVIMQAVLAFNLKGVKPMSLFDSKGKNAFFKSLQSKPALSGRVTDDDIMKARQQVMMRVITSIVQSLEQSDASSTAPLSVKCPQYVLWPQLLAHIARDLCIDVDSLRRHQVCELYSCGLDKMAEEVLRTVGDHAVIGSQLTLIVGRRLHHYIIEGCDPEMKVERLSKCSPNVSTWLKSMDSTQLRRSDVPMSDTAALVGQVVNQLPEGHSEYPLAIELVELSQNLL